MKARNASSATTTNEETLDPIGTSGASLETLEEVKLAAKNFVFAQTTVTLITDWQDRRENARYALMLHQGTKTILTNEAFGPRYGQAGKAALSSLIAWLLEKGASNFKESILAPHGFARVLEDANPTNLHLRFTIYVSQKANDTAILLNPRA
jgi:Protein of unknown function (DUF3197)